MSGRGIPQRKDYYYSIEAEGEFEEGHIFCTVEEAERIEKILRDRLGEDVDVSFDPSDEYDYVTSDTVTAEDVAEDILLTCPQYSDDG